MSTSQRGRVVQGADVPQEVADTGIAAETARTPSTEVVIEGVESQ